MKFKRQLMTAIRPLLHIFLLFQFGTASPIIYSFGKTCSVQPHQINEDAVFYVSFFNTGKPSDMWCSHIAFVGHGSNSKDKYQICTTLERFSDPTCNLRLMLRSSLNGTVFKTFTCGQKSTSKFCAPQSDALYFVAEFNTKDRWTQSEFLFNVETKKTYDLHFFCRNAPFDQESSISSISGHTRSHMTPGSSPPIGDLYQSSIELGPYVIMVNPSFYNSITSTGESDIPVPPPPYNEQEHVTLDPPPEYSSISN